MLGISLTRIYSLCFALLVHSLDTKLLNKGYPNSNKMQSAPVFLSIISFMSLQIAVGIF